MDSFTACGRIEGFVECNSEAEYLEAWQYLIDSGEAWRLQGFYGRTATSLIEQGICLAPVEEEEDLFKKELFKDEHGRIVTLL